MAEPTAPPTKDSPPPRPKEPASAGAPSQGRRLIEVLRFVASRTFVDPVRRGRVAEDPEFPWPRSLALTVTITYVVYAVLVLLAVTGPRLREATAVVLDSSGLSLSYPVVGAVAPAMVLVATLWFLASAHLRHPIRYALVIALPIAFAPRGLLAIGLWLPLIVVWLVLAFRRRRLAQWEVPVVTALFAMLLASNMFTVWDSGDPPLDVLTSSISFLTVLAIPAVLGAGAAITELAVGVASWTARGVWESIAGRGRWWGLTLMVVLVGWTLGANGRAVVTGGLEYSVGSIGATIAYVCLVAGAGLGVLLLVPQGLRPGVPVDTDDVSRAWPVASRPLVTGFAVALMGGLIVLESFFGEFPIESWSWYQALLVLVSGFFAVRAVRVARRGQQTLALIFGAFAAGTFMSQVFLHTGLAIPVEAVPVAVDAIALIALAVLLVRRSWSADRLLAIATVLLLSRLYGYRKFFDEPFTNTLALSSATAALAIGLIWRQLTEYRNTRSGTRAFPVDARVLLALGQTTLLGVTLVSGAVGQSPAVVDLDALEGLADAEVGFVLYLTAASAGLLIAWRGREGGDQMPGDEFIVDSGARIEPKATVPAPPLPVGKRPAGRGQDGTPGRPPP